MVARYVYHAKINKPDCNKRCDWCNKICCIPKMNFFPLYNLHSDTLLFTHSQYEHNRTMRYSVNDSMSSYRSPFCGFRSVLCNVLLSEIIFGCFSQEFPALFRRLHPASFSSCVALHLGWHFFALQSVT